MKVNVNLELCDLDRKLMGEAIHGKPKMVTRQDVRDFVQGCVDSCLQQVIEEPDHKEVARFASTDSKQGFLQQTHGDPHLANKDQSYIVGWNKVKFSGRL